MAFPRSSLLRVLLGLGVLVALASLPGSTQPQQAKAAVQYLRDTSQTYKEVYGRMRKAAVAKPKSPYIHVAVEEKAGHHSEVWPSFVHTLSRMPNIKTSVYLNGGERRCRQDGMYDIVQPFHKETLYDWNLILPALEIEEPAEDRIDLVVSTTCSSTLMQNNTELLAIHDARQTKFKIVCVAHHTWVNDMGWLHKYMEPWVERNSLVLAGLSEHTTRTIKNSMSELAIKWKSAGNVSYAGTPAHTLVPVFPLPDNIAKTAWEKGQRPSKAVIQGKVTTGRRAYRGIFESLMEEIIDDPKLWGWKVSQDPEAPWKVDETVSDPFHLHLLGHVEQKDLIPVQLANVVIVQADLDYGDYYDTLHNNELVIPAFARSDYYNFAASSSIAAAVLAKVPVLATRYHLTSYSYLDQRGVVLIPDNVTPIKAIGRLRSSGTTLPRHTYQAMQGTPEREAFSWPRSLEDANDMSEKIYQRNVESMKRIMTTPLPDYGFLQAD